MRAPVAANVEAVGKPQNFAFSRQKVLGFQGSIFSKEPFSTASLDLTINLGYTMGRKEKRKTTVMTRRSSFHLLAEQELNEAALWQRDEHWAGGVLCRSSICQVLILRII
jgi:hypothetical protein